MEVEGREWGRKQNVKRKGKEKEEGKETSRR